MLILTRRPYEAVIIANNVKVHVLGIKGGQVRLGFEAPPNMLIDREEVYWRKKEEKKREARNKDLRPAATEERPRAAEFQEDEQVPLARRAVG